MIAAYFIYIQLTAIWLNQRIVDGFYYGLYDGTLTPTTQSQNQAIVDNVAFELDGGSLVALVDAYMGLGAASDLTLTGINVYGKGGTGMTVAQNKITTSAFGTRTPTSSGQAMTPQTTFSVYFPCNIYGQKGVKWGLPGVYESDNINGYVETAGNGDTAVANLRVAYQVGMSFTLGGESYQFYPGKVARIEYTTSKNTQAYRMPYESSDEPLVYRVGSGALNPVLGTNNRRKPGRGI